MDLLRAAEIFAKQLSGSARCLFSGIEIMLHREVDPLNVERVESIQNSVSAQLLNLSTPQQQSLFGFVMSSKVETSRFSFLNHDQRFLDYARNERAHTIKNREENKFSSRG